MFVDDWAGRVLTKMDDYGYKDSALIIMVADHGDALGDHNLFRKGYPIQQVATIPMYLRWPETFKVSVDRGHNSTYLTELRDIFPTITDFAGYDITDQVDGRSLLDLVREPDNSEVTCGTNNSARACGVPANPHLNPHFRSQWREYIDLELSSCGFNWTVNWNSLTDGKTKYVYW